MERQGEASAVAARRPKGACDPEQRTQAGRKGETDAGGGGGNARRQRRTAAERSGKLNKTQTATSGSH